VKILHATQPATQNRVIEVVLDGFLGRLMRRRNWAGTTIPLPFLTVILYYGMPASEIRCHEFVHVEQREALGLIGFWVNYIRNTLAFGYQKNPMELAAYDVEAERPLPNWTA
jgi:hypothetical protein